MAFATNINASVQFADSFSIDAFGRSRTSTPFTLFDGKQVYENMPLFWDDVQVSGTATSTYNTNQASTTIAVNNTTAGVRIRQTKRWFNYKPGKSQLIFITFVIGTGSTGCIKRIGYFNNNDGLFLQQSGTTMSIVRRTNVTSTPVDNVITQANWNLDKMDGTGRTLINIDITKTQILVIDFEWLGVGRVRFGFCVDGKIYYFHELLNANNLTKVYMSNPNLPLRYEIVNDGTSSANSLECICSTVMSEGGQDLNGSVRSINRGITAFSTANSTNIFPLISMRLKTTHLGATVLPTSTSISVTSNANFLWSLILNPTIAGVDAANWVDVTNSAIQYDISRSNVNLLSGGTVVASGYGNTVSDLVTSDILTELVLGSTYAGVRDEFILALQLLSGAVETVYAGLNYREIY